MNIAMVVSTFPPDSGGMGQVAYEEALRLARRGNSVTVYTLHSNNHRDTSGMPFIITRLFGMPRFGDGGVVPSLIWRLRRADLVHLHFPFYGAGLADLRDKALKDSCRSSNSPRPRFVGEWRFCLG